VTGAPTQNRGTDACDRRDTCDTCPLSCSECHEWRECHKGVALVSSGWLPGVDAVRPSATFRGNIIAQ
jgi:hypothetical protein